MRSLHQCSERECRSVAQMMGLFDLNTQPKQGQRAAAVGPPVPGTLHPYRDRLGWRLRWFQLGVTLRDVGRGRPELLQLVYLYDQNAGPVVAWSRVMSEPIRAGELMMLFAIPSQWRSWYAGHVARTKEDELRSYRQTGSICDHWRMSLVRSTENDSFRGVYRIRSIYGPDGRTPVDCEDLPLRVVDMAQIDCDDDGTAYLVAQTTKDILQGIPGASISSLKGEDELSLSFRIWRWEAAGGMDEERILTDAARKTEMPWGVRLIYPGVGGFSHPGGLFESLVCQLGDEQLIALGPQRRSLGGRGSAPWSHLDEDRLDSMRQAILRESILPLDAVSPGYYLCCGGEADWQTPMGSMGEPAYWPLDSASRAAIKVVQSRAPKGFDLSSLWLGCPMELAVRHDILE